MSTVAPPPSDQPGEGNGRRILFVTWDGPGLSYLEGLFLPIFAGLASHGWSFDVLQFRWGSAEDEARNRAACAAVGIGYRSATVRRVPHGIGPLATAATGGVAIRRAMRAFGSQMLMPRSTLPAAACVFGRLPDALPIVFDADGLEIDERIEFDGLPPSGMACRVLRDVEAQMMRRASVVLTRTAAAGQVLAARAGPGVTRDHIHVVANGRDPAVFHPFDAATRAIVRDELGIPAAAPLLVYIGGTGHKYDTARIGRLALALRAARSDTCLLVITGDPDKAAAELGMAERPDLGATTRIIRVPPDRAPRYLAAADIGTAFSRVTFSTQGVSPIKVGEYLLCGVPVVGTAGVGNNAQAVADGMYLDEADDLERIVTWITHTVLPNRDGYRDLARCSGMAGYSLARSVSDYAGALAALGSGPPTAPMTA